MDPHVIAKTANGDVKVHLSGIKEKTKAQYVEKHTGRLAFPATVYDQLKEIETDLNNQAKEVPKPKEQPKAKEPKKEVEKKAD